MALRFFSRAFIVFIFIFLGCFLASTDTFAATRTWDGGGATDNWSEDANWSSDTEPGASDLAVFDGGVSSDNVTIDVAVSVGGIEIQSDYAGTVTQAASLTVGTQNFTMAGGSFAGVSFVTRYNGAFSLSGGTYTATTGTFEFYGNITWTGGTLDATGSTFNSYGCGGSTTLTYAGDFNVATNATAFQITKFCGGDFILTAGTTLAATITGGGADVTIQSAATLLALGNVYSGLLQNFGSFTVNAGTYRSGWHSEFDGAVNDLSNATTFDIDYNLVIGTGDTLTLGATAITLYGTYTNNGTFDIAGKTLTFDGCGGTASIAHTGNFNADTGVASVTINKICNGTFTIPSGQILTAASTSGGTVLTIDSGGILTLTGNVSLSTLDNNGSLTLDGGSFAAGGLADFGGILNDLEGVTSMTVGGALTIASGSNFTVSAVATTLNGTAFTVNGPITVAGGGVWPLTIGGFSTNMTLTDTSATTWPVSISYSEPSVDTLLFGSDISISGDFNRIDGSVPNPGVARVFSIGGDLTANTTDTFGGPNLTIRLNHAVDDQTLAILGSGYAGNLAIEKVAGSVIVPESFATAGECVLTQGSLELDGQSFFCDGGFDISGNGVLVLRGDEVLIEPALAAGSTVEYVGDGDGLADAYAIRDFDYANLTINPTDAADSFGPTGIDPLERGLVAYYDFEDGTGSTASDGTGNGYHGSLTNMENGDWSADVPAVAFTNSFSLDFDGVDEFVNLGNPSLFPAGADPVTICMWGKTDTIAGGYRMAFSYGTVGISQAHHIGQNGSTLITGGYGNDITLASAWSVGVWMHVCSIYSDDGDLISYVNGELVASDDRVMNTVRNVAYIGRQVNGFENWNGKLDDVRTYDRALSEGEIQALAAGDNFALSTFTSLTVDGTLTLANGELILPTGTSILAGDLVNSGGTIDPNGGTVDLGDVSQEISGLWTFENLIKTVTAAADLIFPDDEVTTILGDLTLQGVADNLLSILSSTFGLQAQIDPQGARTLQYLDVEDSNNIDVTVMNCGSTCVDSENNTNWAFAPGITVSAISGHTSENETTATFTVVLDIPPTDDVVIDLASDDLTEGTTDLSQLTFTSLNWATPQTVTVTGEDDGIVDGDVAFDIVLDPAVSDDTDYNGINPNDVAVINDDNDVAGITVSAISDNTTEAGGTATFTIVLDSEPTASVAVNVSSSDSTEGVASTATVTFTTGNWDEAQIVTVTGQDDFIDDGNIAYSIILAGAVSVDGAYDGINPNDVSVTNTDDDTAGISVSVITGDTTEAGGTATFDVVLLSQPTASVFIGVSSSDTSEGTVSTGLLTFTTGNWDDIQTVTVTGQDDFIDDGDIAYSIILDEAGSTDPLYDVINPNDVSVTNLDGDVAAFVVSVISGNTTEAGGTATFTVYLASQPADPVTLPVSSSDAGEGTPDVSELVFTDSDWDEPQTVTVTGQDDIFDDGNVPYQIILGAAASDDLIFDGLNPSDVNVTNVDDDVIGVSATGLSGNTEEDGTQATFNVVLLSEPTADVTVPIASNDVTEGTTDVSELVFTDLNWAVPQVVTITGQDDDLNDGDILYSVLLGVTESTDPQYDNLNPADVTLQNIDDENAGFVVSVISGNTTEAGGTATFTVVLISEPTDDVTIAVASNDVSEGTSNVTELIFTALNWDEEQIVTVTGVNDFLDDGLIAYSIILSAVTSDDLDYHGLNPADVSVSNVDDDIAGFTVSAISGDTNEGGATAGFSVVLTSQPTSPVTIDITSDDTSEGTVNVAELVFTDLNWNIAQNITVTGVDDDIVDGDIAYSVVLAAAESLDLNYDTLDPEDRPLENIDDDTLGVLVNESSFSTEVSEAGATSDTYMLVLASEPSADVVVTLSFDALQIGVSPALITFTDTNWNTPRVVTVTAVDDDIDETSPHTELIIADIESADGGYDGYLITNIDVEITDNDVSDVDVSAPSPSAHTTEAGGVVTFTVVLTAEPANDVSLPVATDTAEEGVVASAASLTFTALNWETPQTVTVTGQDDDRDDGDVGYDITLGPLVSDDPLYDGQMIASVSLVNDDDDTFGISLVETGGTTQVAEDGATSDTYEIVLESEPFDDVAISLSYDAAEVSVSDDTLIFTALNWSTPQVVTVTALDDTDDEALDNLVAYETIITHAVVSDDLAYDSVVLSAVTVEITDDDDAPVDSGGSRGSSQSFVSNASVSILGVSGAVCADRSQVVLRLSAVDATSVLIDSDENFVAGQWQPFVADNSNDLSTGGLKVMTVPWTLLDDEGEQVVYVKFRSNTANMTGTYLATIQLGTCDESIEGVEAVEEEVATEPADVGFVCEPGMTGPSPFDGSIEEIVCVTSGQLIRGEHYDTIYRIENGVRYPFLNEAVYFTWQTSFDDVEMVTDATLPVYPLGQSVLPNPTTILVKIASDSRVYVTSANDGVALLHPILSEEDAQAAYGTQWQQFVIDLPDTIFTKYAIAEAFDPQDATNSLLFARIGLQAFDSDRDGLSDRAETLLGTDRFHPDTDRDSYLDGIEIMSGYSPLVASGGARIDLRALDSDNDELSDFVELMLGTDPMDSDSDDDGYDDGLEVATGHDPLVAP